MSFQSQALSQCLVLLVFPESWFGAALTNECYRYAVLFFSAVSSARKRVWCGFGCNIGQSFLARFRRVLYAKSLAFQLVIVFSENLSCECHVISAQRHWASRGSFATGPHLAERQRLCPKDAAGLVARLTYNSS